MLKKLGAITTGITLAATLTLALAATAGAQASKPKVDCDAVMAALNGGKKVSEVASDMGISKYSVRKCKRKAKAAAAESTPAAAASPAAGTP